MGSNLSGVLAKRGLNTEAHAHTCTHTEGDMKRHRERPCEGQGRNQGDKSPSQGTPKIASKTPETKKGREGFPCRLQRERGPVSVLVSGSLPSEWRDNISVVLSHLVCGSLFRWPQETKTKGK